MEYSKLSCMLWDVTHGTTKLRKEIRAIIKKHYEPKVSILSNDSRETVTIVINLIGDGVTEDLKKIYPKDRPLIASSIGIDTKGIVQRAGYEVSDLTVSRCTELYYHSDIPDAEIVSLVAYLEEKETTFLRSALHKQHSPDYYCEQITDHIVKVMKLLPIF